MKSSTCLWLAITITLFITTFTTQFLILILTCIAFSIIGFVFSLYSNLPSIASDYDIFSQSCQLHLLEEESLSVNRILLSRRLHLNGQDNHVNVRDDVITSSSSSTTSSSQVGSNFTGDPIIDEQLNDVLRLACRDYIDSWYCFISPDRQFPLELQNNAKIVVKSLSQKISSMDFDTFITTKLVDDFASHLRLYRLAQTNQKQLKTDDPNANLLSMFFDYEAQMEKNICRDLVSEDKDSCLSYLSHICDALQYLLLPAECFKNRPLRYLFRSIFVKSILYPLLELFSDPDFINQTIVWLFKSYIVSSDTFINVLRCCDNSEELEAVKEIVNHEMAVMRAKDTGGDDDFEIKQELSSLLFVKNVIDSRLKCLNDGCADNDSIGVPSQTDWKQVKLFSLPFDVILKNNIALSYFIEFMSGIGAKGYIYFYLNVEGFKISAEQQLSEIQLQKLNKSENERISIDLDSLKEAAMNIYDTYLSDKASHKLKLEDAACRKIYSRICTESVSENWFDDIQAKIYDIMMNDESFYASFKKSKHYYKLLAELDLLKEFNVKNEDEPDCVSQAKSDKEDNSSLSLSFDDTDSINSFEETLVSNNVNDTTLTADNLSVMSDGSANSNTSTSTSGYSSTKPFNSSNEEWQIIADITKCGIIREYGNIYAAYVINVIKRVNGYPEENWISLRRYSDFYNFHKNLMEKLPDVTKMIALPGKRTFNNMSKDFVEQRRHLLNTYLAQLLKLSSTKQPLKEQLLRFLQPGNYQKEKFQLSKTVQNSIFNPLKSSVMNVTNVMKTGSENLFDGLQKLSRLGSAGSSGSSGGSNPSKSSVPIINNLFGINPSNMKSNQQNQKSSTSSSNSNSKTPLCLSPTLIESSNFAANLDFESEDNIPLRIMLLLMDEVFDLKNKDLWLRRRIVAFMRQIIQATYGDAINRKIVEYVEELTCAASLAEYIKTFKNSFWPNGLLAQTQPTRSQSTKLRTRIAAKMLLLSSLTDELKHLIGSETTRKGLFCIFEMFQHEQLNRRFVLVLFEGILQELFPQNHFSEIFQKLHSKSLRIPECDKKTNNWPPFLYKFLGTEKSKSPAKSPTPSQKRRKMRDNR